MDPTINQTPTPTPVPAPTPAMPSMPLMNQAPAPEPVSSAPVISAMPQMATPGSANPVVNPATVATPGANTADSPIVNASMPDNPAVAGGAIATDNSTVVGMSADRGSSQPSLPEAPELPDLAGIVQEVTMSAESNAPSSSVNAPQPLTFEPTGNGLADTTPLTMPEAPAGPDPVEEELKAPLKPAAPVPGSIGSSISGPATNTPSVAFNDPAVANMMANASLPTKKRGKMFGGKMDKTTLILLCVVGAMVVIALVVVLVMQLM